MGFGIITALWLLRLFEFKRLKVKSSLRWAFVLKRACNINFNNLYSSLRRQNLQSTSATHKRNPWFFYARNKANSHLAPLDQLCREGGSHTIPFVGKTARRSS